MKTFSRVMHLLVFIRQDPRPHLFPVMFARIYFIIAIKQVSQSELKMKNNFEGIEGRIFSLSLANIFHEF